MLKEKENKSLVVKVFENPKKESVKELLEHIDNESGNEMMKMFSSQYKIPVVNVNGILRTSTKEVMKLFGITKRCHLPQLWKKYGLQTLKLKGLKEAYTIKGYTPETAILQEIAETLNLSPLATDVCLPGWQEILVAGIHGRTEMADKIKRYLLTTEKYARSEIYVQSKGQKSLREYVKEKACIDENANSMNDISNEIIKEISSVSLPKDEYIGLLKDKIELCEMKIKKSNAITLKRMRGNVTLKEVELIRNLKETGFTATKIAEKIGRSPSTVSRIFKYD